MWRQFLTTILHDQGRASKWQAEDLDAGSHIKALYKEDSPIFTEGPKLIMALYVYLTHVTQSNNS